MPRDSNGAYTLPNGTLVSTGDTVLPSQHNPAMQDIAQALTNSLDRNGNGGMQTDLQMGNNRITGLEDGVDPTDAATVGQLSGGGSAVPLGVVVDFWGTVAPEGFMFCYGQAISRSTYAELFAAIGTNAGAGDGSTTFNLPDYRGRSGAGKDDMGGTAANRLTSAGSGLNGTTLGAAGGSQTHTLTTAQMPSHSHSGTTDSASAAQVVGSAPAQIGGDNIPIPAGAAHTHTFTTNTSGGGEAHNNVPPTIVCNKIMRVL